MPFVVAGGGLFQTSENQPLTGGAFRHNEGAFTAGGGVRALVSDRVIVGAEARVGWETHVRVNGFVGFRLGS
jgi:opacity protein-like surface antigen